MTTEFDKGNNYTSLWILRRTDWLWVSQFYYKEYSQIQAEAVEFPAKIYQSKNIRPFSKKTT